MVKKEGLLLAVQRFLLHKLYLPFIYNVSRLAGRDMSKVVFVSESRTELEPSLALLRDEIQKRGYRTAEYTDCKKSAGRRIKAYTAFTRDYARCGAVVLEDYFLPAYSNRPRRGTQLIQLWHACGAFKRWGWASVKTGWGMDEKTARRYHMHRGYTAAVVSAEAVRDQYAEAFNCGRDVVKAHGVPRTDVFWDEEYKAAAARKFFDRYPLLRSRIIVLYAPTFRGERADAAKSGDALDYGLLKKRLGMDYAVVTKLHPFATDNAPIPDDCRDFAFDVSGFMDINEMLTIADIVVTDYSSLIFEYALMKRPMIFYAYDLGDYESERSFFFGYEGFVPGPVARTGEELAEMLLSARGNPDAARTAAAFAERYMSACDGASTKRVADEFFPPLQ